MPKLLTIKEVADLLKVTRASVGNYIKSGDLKAIRLSGIYRIKETELTNFIERKSQF